MSGMSAIGGMQTRMFEPPSFSKLDGDSSGEITLEELKSNAPGGTSGSERDARTQKLFDALDADGSGGISEDEKSSFDAAQQERMASLGFSAQVMGDRPPPPPPPPSGEDVVGALDTDEDGGISLEEFTASSVVEDADSAAIEELFATLDADSDGSISADEAESFLAENKPKGGPRGAGGPPPPPPADEDDDEGGASSIALDALSAAISAYESPSTSADALTSNLMDLLEGEA